MTMVPRVRSRGFEAVEDEPLEGFDRLYASDPFGNRVELMEPGVAPPDEKSGP